MKRDVKGKNQKDVFTKRVMLTFSRRLVSKPVMYRLIKEYDIAINILFAKVLPNETGKLVVEFSSTDEKKIQKGFSFLKSLGVKIEPISKEIIRDEENCIDCGACTSVCRSQALSIDKETFELIFDSNRCVLCEMCIHACPMRAISITF
ncbi:MAG: 4Fe-4S binding protein [Deltaproteobacteria bacterium]|nr:4Fe-4S binding protein [Deltaproteobacteria bacterium]